MEVAEEGEVAGEHVSGILGQDVLVGIAGGVHVVVGRVAEGLDVQALPGVLVVNNYYYRI